MKKEDLSQRSQEKLKEVGSTITVVDFINEVLFENDFQLNDILTFCKREFEVSKNFILKYTKYNK